MIEIDFRDFDATVKNAAKGLFDSIPIKKTYRGDLEGQKKIIKKSLHTRLILITFVADVRQKRSWKLFLK